LRQGLPMPPMTFVSRRAMTLQTFTAVACSAWARKSALAAGLPGAAILGALVLGTAAPASAADLAPLPRTHARHVRHVRIAPLAWDWRERCAYAGYYCLYAEYRTVYHYPFDDRPVAQRRARLRVR